MKLIALFFISAALAAQPHFHIKDIAFYPEKSLLTWTSQEANEDEEESPAVTSWRISFSSITISNGEGLRNFDPEEAAIIGKNFMQVTEFLKALVKAEVTHFIINPYEGVMTIHSPSHIYTATHDCRLDADAMPPRSCDTLNHYARKIAEYCLESVIWWIMGEGNPARKA